MSESLSDLKIQQLRKQANEIRQSIIESLIEAKSGHSAGPLGMADVFALLYFHILKHDPKRPKWKDRDLLVLSNGHICPVLYSTMAHSGYFPVEELKTLRKFGSRLQGHPHREYLPMLETSSGPLGSGLSQAIGMALAIRVDEGKRSDRFVYCITGDGELNEGQIWESLQLAGKEKLHALITIVDRNNIQIDGYTEDVMPLEPLVDRFKSFNWHVLEADGHNFRDINEKIGQAQAVFDKPTVIITYTIPGKGVEFMQRDFRWHGSPPGGGPEDIVKKGEQGKEALRELRTLGGMIKGEHE
jgi:transketolase